MALTLALVLAAPATAHAADDDDEVDPLGKSVDEMELGVRLGAQLGQAVAPGGFRIAGVYLHRMTQATWFDLEVAFTLGDTDAFCFKDRFGDLVCDAGLAQGVSGQVAVGGRWFPVASASGFVPYLRGGAALHVSQFSGDEVTGWALPLFVGGGIRTRVGGIASVGGEVVVLGGAALYTDGLGVQPYGGLVVQFGVDLAL